MLLRHARGDVSKKFKGLGLNWTAIKNLMEAPELDEILIEKFFKMEFCWWEDLLPSSGASFFCGGH